MTSTTMRTSLLMRVEVCLFIFFILPYAPRHGCDFLFFVAFPFSISISGFALSVSCLSSGGRTVLHRVVLITETIFHFRDCLEFFLSFFSRLLAFHRCKCLKINRRANPRASGFGRSPNGAEGWMNSFLFLASNTRVP